MIIFALKKNILFKFSGEENSREGMEIRWKQIGTSKENIVRGDANCTKFMVKAEENGGYKLIDETEFESGELKDGKSNSEFAGTPAGQRNEKLQNTAENAQDAGRRVNRDDNEKEFGIERLTEEFNFYAETASQYLGKKIDESAVDKAVAASKKVAQIGRAAKKLMDAEIAPFKSKIDTVSEIYKPLIDKCAKLSKELKKAYEEVALERARKAAEAQAEEQAKVKAEKLRLAAEAEKLAPKIDDSTANIQELSKLASAIDAVERKENNLNAELKAASSAGVTGLKASIRKIQDAVITDPAMFVCWLQQNDKENYDKVVEAMRLAAVRLYKAGQQPKGASSTVREVLA